MRECVEEGCRLFQVQDVFPDLDTPHRDRCYRHQADELRAEQRYARALAHKQWLDSGVMDEMRQALQDRASEMGLE